MYAPLPDQYLPGSGAANPNDPEARRRANRTTATASAPKLVASPTGHQTASVPPPIPNRITGQPQMQAPVPVQTGMPVSQPAQPAAPGAFVGKPVQNLATQAAAQPPANPATPVPQSPPAPASAPASAPAAAPVIPAGTTAITGDEGYYSVNPTQPDGLAALVQRLQQAATGALDAPTAYDDELFKRTLGEGLQTLDQQGTAARARLDADLARRGVDFGTIAGSRGVDLETALGQQRSGLVTQLLTDRAQALAAGRAQALAGASNVAGLTDSLGRADRAEQRGERAYVDQLRDKAQDDARFETLTQAALDRQEQQDSFQQILASLGLGLQGTNLGLGALGDAGRTYGYGAGAYGDIAADNNDQLQQALAGLYGLWFPPAGTAGTGAAAGATG